MMTKEFDKKYLAKLACRDGKAIERWFGAYCDALYTFVYYRVEKDAELAADIVQETFTEAIRQIDRYDAEKGSMFAWLTYLSKNHITKALRVRGRHLSYEDSWGSVDGRLLRCFELIATEPLPDEIVERKETAQLVQMTLANIPANYKQVLKDYYYQRKAVKEIAILQGVSEGAIKALLFRARKAFKEAFIKLGESFNGPDVVKGGSNE